MAKAEHRAFRHQIGFTNQELARKFLSAKSIEPEIDTGYIDQLTCRLCEITNLLNQTIHADYQHDNIEVFNQEHILAIRTLCEENHLLPRFNNYGRRVEHMFHSWLCGHAMAQFLIPALIALFDVPTTSIAMNGDDDPSEPETFDQTPKADLLIEANAGTFLIEIQVGFQGKYNDIKKHKFKEARRAMDEDQLGTICIHFDIFNGQIAFVRLDQSRDNQNNWAIRPQMEGQTVYPISENEFKWLITDPLPTLDSLDLNL